jgi:hypothetical protein
MSYDPGPGQPYGLTNKLDKDAGDGFTRAPDFPPTGEVEERRPTPNASDDPEQEPAEID